MAREERSVGSGRDNPPQQRRLGRWGFEGECYAPSAPLLAWLEGGRLATLAGGALAATAPH